MKYRALATGLALMSAGCETLSEGAASRPPSAAPLDLGDWRRAPAGDTLTQFQATIAARYAAGAPISDAAADLRSNNFTCAANVDTTGRGAPPAEICRRTVTADTCTATWQVHFSDTNGDGRIVHARALFDRRCGREGLLGGPS